MRDHTRTRIQITHPDWHCVCNPNVSQWYLSLTLHPLHLCPSASQPPRTQVAIKDLADRIFAVNPVSKVIMYQANVMVHSRQASLHPPGAKVRGGGERETQYEWEY